MLKKSNFLLTEPTMTVPTEKDVTYAITIGVSLGGLFVVVLCIIFFVRLCNNRNAAHRGNPASDKKPPVSEEYELKSVAVNNACVSVGEVSLGCDEQKTGFSNEGFSDTTLAFPVA